MPAVSAASYVGSIQSVSELAATQPLDATQHKRKKITSHEILTIHGVFILRPPQVGTGAWIASAADEGTD
jgi:hypothetical protein